MCQLYWVFWICMRMSEMTFTYWRTEWTGLKSGYQQTQENNESCNLQWNIFDKLQICKQMSIMVKGIYFVEKVNREETISGSTPEAISMRRTKLQKKKKKKLHSWLLQSFFTLQTGEKFENGTCSLCMCLGDSVICTQACNIKSCPPVSMICYFSNSR